MPRGRRGAGGGWTPQVECPARLGNISATADCVVATGEPGQQQQDQARWAHLATNHELSRSPMTMGDIRRGRFTVGGGPPAFYPANGSE